jgi:hypothetical protein
MPEALVEDDVVDADRVKRLSLRLEMGYAVANRLIDNFVVIELVEWWRYCRLKRY